jgi:hypothetical protein
VRASFEALAEGDTSALVRLVDPESLERARKTLLALNGVEAASLRDAPPARIVEHVLKDFPAIRSSISCEPIGYLLEHPELAHTLFRLRWGSTPILPEVIHVATLRRREGGWRVVLSPFSRWLLPGFENLLLSDEMGT